MKKGKLIFALCLILAVVIGTGSTMAYLSFKAGEKTNVFSFSEDIRASLSEPNWDAGEGLLMVPGLTVPKDPMITNTCDVNEYTAIRLTFQYSVNGATLSNADYQRLVGLLEINWNLGSAGSNWTIVNGGGTPQIIYVYNSILTPGKVTEPLLHSIKIKTKAQGLKEEDLRWLQGIKFENGVKVSDTTGLENFNIKVEGAVIAADGFKNVAEASPQLQALFS